MQKENPISRSAAIRLVLLLLFVGSYSTLQAKPPFDCTPGSSVYNLTANGCSQYHLPPPWSLGRIQHVPTKVKLELLTGQISILTMRWEARVETALATGSIAIGIH